MKLFFFKTAYYDHTLCLLFPVEWRSGVRKCLEEALLLVRFSLVKK
jgi:hypothetical protein